MSKKYFTAFTLAVLSAGAWPANRVHAQESVEALVRKALESVDERVQIDALAPSPLPGFYQVIASGNLVYVSSDGKYLLNGDLIDIAKKASLSEDSWAAYRKTELAKVPVDQRIVFAPAHPKYTITVFTDVDCGYCRAFHNHIAEINKRGVAVEYLAWPRSGMKSAAAKDLANVWCAADRKTALTEAKQGKTLKKSPGSCSDTIKAQYELGVRLGVQGTPAIIAPTGQVIGGYLGPDDLMKALQQP